MSQEDKFEELLKIIGNISNRISELENRINILMNLFQNAMSISMDEIKKVKDKSFKTTDEVYNHLINLGAQDQNFIYMLMMMFFNQ